MTWRRGLLVALAAPAILVLWAALSLAWIATTPGGLRFAAWLAERVSGTDLEIHATEGRLLGPLQIGRLVHRSSERHVVAEDVALEWQPDHLFDGLLLIESLRIGRLRIASRPDEEPPKPPTDLTLPVAVRVDAFRIGQAGFGTLTGNESTPGMEVTGIDGRFSSDGQSHRLETLRFATPRLTAEASGSLGGGFPFPVTATARVSGEEFGHPFLVTLAADGSLGALAIKANSISDAVQVNGEARLDLFAPQPLIRGALTVAGLDPASWVDGAPHAKLALEAVATPEAGSSRAAPNLIGEVTAVNSEPGRLDEERIPLRRLHARFRQTGQRLVVPAFTASLTEGTVTGSAQWVAEELVVDARLAAVNAAAWHKSVKKTALGGDLKARLSAATQTVQTELQDPRFRLTLDATRSGGKLRVERALLAARGGSLDLAGSVDPAGEYDLKGRLQNFDPGAFADVPKGRLNAALDARGRLGERPSMNLHFVLGDSVFDGRPVVGQGDVVLRPDRLEQADVTLRAGDNRLEGHGRLGHPGDTLNLRIDAPRLEQIGLGGAIAGTVTLSGRLPVPNAEWDLKSPRLRLPDGRELRNLASQGRWTGQSHERALPPLQGEGWGGDGVYPSGAIRAELTIGHLSLNGETLPPLQGEGRGGDGVSRQKNKARVEGRDKSPSSPSAPSEPSTDSDFSNVSNLSDISLRINGQRNRHRVEASAQVNGKHPLQLTGNGGLGPDRVWAGELETLAWRGPNPFHLVGTTHLEAGPGRLVLRQAVLAGTDWKATIEGLRWSPDRLQSNGRFGSLPAALFLPAEAASSTLRLGGDWNIDFGQRADGNLRVFRQEGDLAVKAGEETLALGLERLQATANFAGQEATLSLQAQGTQAGTLDGHLTAAMRSENGGWTVARNAPWQGSLRLDTPSIAWLSSLAGENVRLGGRLQGDISVGGTPATPTTSGQVSGSELRFRLLDYGLDLSGGTLRLDLTPETVRLQRLELVSIATQPPYGGGIDFRRLTAQPGRLIAEGEIALESGHGRIDLRADQLAVSQLPDRWVMVSGTGGARFAEGRLAFSGDVRVDAAYVTLAGADQPTLSADVVVIRPGEKKRPPPRVNLNLEIDLGSSFHFQGAGIDSRLAGRLRLIADGRSPLRANGSVHTVGGTFDAYGRELSIERGILNFAGLVDNPGLNVLALRTETQVKAGVEVTGTLKDPRVRLVSEPDVPDTEKLSWMVLGRPPGGAIGTQDADLLLSAAASLRGKQGKGPLQSLMQGLRLDELSVASGSLDERSQFPTAHVAGRFTSGDSITAAEQIATIGKRIGSNAVLSYERSLTSAENILKLTVDLGRGLSVVGRVGANNAIGLLYTFTFGGGQAAAKENR